MWLLDKKDLNSSNGTFVNGQRISKEGKIGSPFELKTKDVIDLGVDIPDDDGKDLYKKVTLRVTWASESEAVGNEEHPRTLSTLPSPLSVPLLDPKEFEELSEQKKLEEIFKLLEVSEVAIEYEN